MRKTLTLSLALWLLCLPVFGQRRDSVYTASERFHWEKLIVPVSLVGVGTICAYLPAYQTDVNLPVRAWAARVRGENYLPIDDYIQYAPILAYGIAAACGAGNHKFLEQLMTGATAGLLCWGMSQGIKYATSLERPNGKAHTFPSGHTAMAFMGAELIRLEYGIWWGLGAYTVALGTAFLRVYNEWHWTSDLIAGAGIGILCANAAYWLLPLERKWFHVNPKLASVHTAALPYCAPTPYGAAYGMSLTMSF